MTIFKLTDQIVTSSTSLVTIEDFAVPMKSYRRYQISGYIFYETPAAADFKWRHTGPASPLFVKAAIQCISQTAVLSTQLDTAYSVSDIVNSSSSTSLFIRINAIIHNGANQGGLNIQFAQNVSDPGETKILAGSYLEYHEVK